MVTTKLFRSDEDHDAICGKPGMPTCEEHASHRRCKPGDHWIDSKQNCTRCEHKIDHDTQSATPWDDCPSQCNDTFLDEHEDAYENWKFERNLA